MTNRTPEGDSGSFFLDGKVLQQILEIVRNAPQQVTFVTPYVRLWGHRQNARVDATDRGVGVCFIVRADENDQLEELKWKRSRIWAVKGINIQRPIDSDMAQAKSAAVVKESLFGGILEALANKHSQLDINLQGMSIKMLGMSVEFSGLISISSHIRDITEDEKKASAAKNVMLMSKV